MSECVGDSPNFYLSGARGDEVQSVCPSIIRWDTAFTDQVTGISYAFFRVMFTIFLYRNDHIKHPNFLSKSL